MLLTASCSLYPRHSSLSLPFIYVPSTLKRTQSLVYCRGPAPSWGSTTRYVGFRSSIPRFLLIRTAEDPHNPNPSKWHAISKHVPNRTNKDCRKRWFAKMASDVVKGGWSPQEDEKLVSGIERYGTRYEFYLLSMDVWYYLTCSQVVTRCICRSNKKQRSWVQYLSYVTPSRDFWSAPHKNAQRGGQTHSILQLIARRGLQKPYVWLI